MTWTGKVVGAGFSAFVLGPIGAVVGHWFDQPSADTIPEELQVRLAILAVLASAAAANGAIGSKERFRPGWQARNVFAGYPPDYAENWLATVAQAPVSLEDCSQVVRLFEALFFKVRARSEAFRAGRGYLQRD